MRGQFENSLGTVSIDSEVVATYSRYENDDRGIPLETICALADFHNTSVDYLLGRTNQKKPYPKALRHDT